MEVLDDQMEGRFFRIQTGVTVTPEVCNIFELCKQSALISFLKDFPHRYSGLIINPNNSKKIPKTALFLAVKNCVSKR